MTGFRRNSRRPVIGVTGPDRGGWISWICTRVLVTSAGGRPLRITPLKPSTIDRIDGLILGGGADIHPCHYKEEIFRTIQRETKRVRRLNFRFFLSIFLWLLREVFSVGVKEAEPNEPRDALEFGLISAAVERKIPVLGICRGEQLINIFFGGTLYQEIRDFYSQEPVLETHRARKWVNIEPGSCLEGIFQTTRARVNSLHHQSVKTLGKGLRVSARENSGIIQAIEHTELPFVLGLQWHPEFLPLHPRQRLVFYHLINAARKSDRANQTVGHNCL